MTGRKPGDAACRERPRDDGRGGFVMAVVVFILFAIGLAGTAAYQIVRLEAEMAGQGRDVEVALEVARAGLERFVGGHYGIPPDSTSFGVGEHMAIIETRKLSEVDSVTDLYHIQSTGLVEDSRWSDAPARRTAHQYALLHKDPVGIHAALLAASGNVRVRNGGRVDGQDQASSSDCSVGGRFDKIGIANTGNASDQGGGTIAGSPDHVSFGTAQAIADSARVRWDVLSSPAFSIAHDGEPPDWGGVASDSFPVMRATDDLDPGSAWSGRGVLIVPGEFSMSAAFDWDGIILAGSIGNLNAPGSRIRGVVIGGLEGAQGSVQVRRVDIRYHSCNALAASASIAYLEPLPNTTFEGS